MRLSSPFNVLLLGQLSGWSASDKAALAVLAGIAAALPTLLLTSF
ncbi:hypothetical protein [Roseibium algae]|uniref:Uncharacterized protein n=1 Tax=Roseibium algae TaxID=3123038 RepID=A0ABU8TQI7_9HYPH